MSQRNGDADFADIVGEVALETTSSELLADEEMQRRYLGVEPTAA